MLTPGFNIITHERVIFKHFYTDLLFPLGLRENGKTFAHQVVSIQTDAIFSDQCNRGIPAANESGLWAAPGHFCDY